MRELIVGDHLDQYDLTELLARSGMASIFKAVDRASGNVVALKVPYMQFESDVVFHERFKREEDIGRRLDHPNIIRILTPKEKSRMYMALEFVEGMSLRALIHQKPALTVDKALDIARQVCEALVYMHGKGVVHRDLKPENILVNDQGHAKLLDFGIALDESARRLTWFGFSSTIGTPDYMAPEQVSGRRGDDRTDIYALGTILYEMMTGELPFSGTNVQSLMRSKQNDEPRPPSHVFPGIDPQIEEIIMHAIESSPRYRYATAAEMLAELRDPKSVKPRGTEHRTRKRWAPLIPWRFAKYVIFAAVFGSLISLVWLSSRNAARRHTVHPPVPSELK